MHLLLINIYNNMIIDKELDFVISISISYFNNIMKKLKLF